MAVGLKIHTSAVYDLNIEKGCMNSFIYLMNIYSDYLIFFNLNIVVPRICVLHYSTSLKFFHVITFYELINEIVFGIEYNDSV